ENRVVEFLPAVVPRPGFCGQQEPVPGQTIGCRLLPYPRKMRAGGVASSLKSKVIGFETRADSPQGCIDRHVALVLVEIDTACPTLHRRQSRLQPHMFCVRTL